MKTIDIVLPVFNEEEGIAEFHAILRKELDTLTSRYNFQLIYVVDRCRDRSFEILKSLAGQSPNVTVLHLSRRFGHQMSLVAGIDQSEGDAVIMMDCDQQHPPEVIPLLLEKFEEGYDIVHTIRHYDVRVGIFRRWTSSLFYWLQNALSPIDLKEGAADFRLVSDKVARLFQSSVREQNQFLRGLFQWVGFRSTEVAFVSPPRTSGATKYSILRLLEFSISGITSFSKVPLRIASLLGFAMSSLSLLYGVWLVVEYFYAGHMPPGYTSLIVMILFLGGLQLSVLGILGEYLASIFDEVKRRPLYVIDEVVKSAR